MAIIEFPNDARINFDISVWTENHSDRVIIQETKSGKHDYHVAIFLTEFDTDKMQQGRAIALQIIKSHTHTGQNGMIFYNAAI